MGKKSFPKCKEGNLGIGGKEGHCPKLRKVCLAPLGWLFPALSCSLHPNLPPHPQAGLAPPSCR
jgi:hypothetical protein